MNAAIIVPYFGNLPFTFNDWVESVKGNQDVDFYLFTDQNIDSDLPQNIYVTRISFSVFKERVMSELALSRDFTPYKLCDFKVTYGVLFGDMLKTYDYWGYSDLDLVYGNLSQLVKRKDIFGVYDKVFDLGHVSFFRNNNKINNLYLSSPEWKYIKNSEIIWVFDESYDQLLGGINSIIEQQGFKLYNDRSMFSDVLPDYLDFVDKNIGKDSRCFFTIQNKTLKVHYLCGDEVVEVEKIYAHFQKRKYRKTFDSTRGMVLVPFEWEQCNSYDDAKHYLMSRKHVPLETKAEFKEFLFRRRIKKYKSLFKELILGICSISSIHKLLKSNLKVKNGK